MLLLGITCACNASEPAGKSVATPARETASIPTKTTTNEAVKEAANPLDPYKQAELLGKGINLGNALEAPNEGDWGLTLEENDFKLLKEAGFDSVRVPIKWSNHTSKEAPYTVDVAFFERIDWVIQQALDNHLRIVINMHNYDEIFQQPKQERDRFIAIWKQIAERYKNKPDSMYFEFLNEPHDALTSIAWNRLLAAVRTEFRKIDDYHTIIIGTTNWGAIDGLIGLHLPQEEKNAIVTFHYYNPYLFTHQGAEWGGPEIGTLGVEWPGPPSKPAVPAEEAGKIDWVSKWFRDYNQNPDESNPGGKHAVMADLDQAANWSAQEKRPLWLGEFGAYSKGDMASRVRWTSFVRSEAEKRGFRWAYWEYASGFGVYSKQDKIWREELLRALIPGS
jgi:endoglucanase